MSDKTFLDKKMDISKLQIDLLLSLFFMMKKNWFLFFALLFLLGFSPVFALEATIVGTPTSLWLKPQKVTPTTTCGVELGDNNASWIDFWKDCWEDVDSRRNNAERDRQARHDRIELQWREDWGANFHPRVNFKDDHESRSASFEGVKYKKYYETFIVRKVSDLSDNVHVPFQILRGSSSRDNWFVKWQGDPFSYSTGNSQRNNRDAYWIVSINWGENRLIKPGVHIYWGWGNRLLNVFNAGFKYRIGPKYSPASDRYNKSAVMNNDDIYEIISISQNWGLTSDQRAQVASYLAIKYGIPLRHDYFAGNGTKVYDLSSYGNQVFGLGKDIDTTSLDQRIAKSLEDDDLIISTDDNFTKLNDQHKPLNDKTYLLLWNNAKTYTQTTTDGLEKSADEQYFTMRSQKIWKIQNTDFSQSVNLQFGSAFTGLVGADDKYVLLVSSDDRKFSELESIKWTGELIDGKLVFKDVELPAGTSYMTVAIRDLTSPEWLDFDGDQYYPKKFFSGANFPLATTGTKDLGVGIREFVCKVKVKKWSVEIWTFTGEKLFNIPICQTATETNCIPEGRGFWFDLSVVDRAGNEKSVSDTEKHYMEEAIIVDRTPPKMTLKPGTDEIWINYGESFNLSTETPEVSDNLQHSGVRIDLKTNPDPLPTSPFTGSFRVIYTATDWAGNSTQKERTIRVNEAPTIEGLSVHLGTANDKKNPTITFTPKDQTRSLTTGKIEIYEWGTTNLLITKSLSSLNNGTEVSEPFTLDEKTYYTVKVQIRDEGGLFREETLSYPPIVHFEPNNFVPTSGDLAVTVKIWSPWTLSEVKFQSPFIVKVGENQIIQGGDFLDKCTTTTGQNTTGQNTTCQLTISSSSSQTGDLKIIATDDFSAGNNTLKLIIDQTKPTTPVFTTPSADTVQNSKNLKFQWNNLTDKWGAGLDKIFWKLKKGEDDLESGEFTDLTTRTLEKADMKDGSYTLTLWTQDKAGNKSKEAVSHKIQIDTTAPNEIQNLTSAFDPDSAKLSFSWNKTTDEGVGLSGYLWTFKKGNQELSWGMLGDEANPSLSFENIAKENASYTLTLQAVDKVGNKTSEQTISYKVQLVELTFRAGEHVNISGTTYFRLFSGAKQENLTLPTLTPDPWYKLKTPAREPDFNTSDRATENKTYTGNAEKDPDQRVKLTIHHQEGTGTESPFEVLKISELSNLPLQSYKTGFLLTGWAATSGGTILPADTKFTADTDLFAVWEKDPEQWIELQFETLDGTAVTGTSFLLWTLASELPKSQKSWFTFGGWNYTGGAILPSNTALITSGTLYANWTKDPDQRVKLTFDVKWGTTLSGQEVLKNAELLSGDLPTTTKSGHLFRGWSLDGTTVLSYPRSFDQNITLSAVWEKDPSQWISLSYDLQWGVLSSPNPDSLLSWTLLSTLSQPSRSWFHFSGWNYTGEAILPSNTTLIKSGTLYANRSENPLERLTITYHLNDGSAQQKTSKLLKSGATFQALIPEPTRMGYTFIWWTKDLAGQQAIALGASITGDLAIYAQWKPIPSIVPTHGYSGGGGFISHSASQNSTPSSQETIKNTELSKEEKEQQTAYERAYENKITTLYPQTEARLFEPITRAELAKMMSVYTTKFLKKIPISWKLGCSDFQDKDQTSPELAGFMQTACELEIMGLHSDGKTPLSLFRPNDLVSRAEFATVLSRMKRGNQYDNNQPEWRWEDHLKNLHEKMIITIPDPNIIELRGRILLMLHRMER